MRAEHSLMVLDISPLVNEINRQYSIPFPCTQFRMKHSSVKIPGQLRAPQPDRRAHRFVPLQSDASGPGRI